NARNPPPGDISSPPTAPPTPADNFYTARTSQTILVAAGSSAEWLTVNTTADNKVEADETFTATLGGLNAGGRNVSISGSNGSARSEKRRVGKEGISRANASNTKENGGGFTITLSNAVEVPSCVTFSTTD